MTQIPLIGADDLRKKDFLLRKNIVRSSDRISFRSEETWEMTSRKQGMACGRIIVLLGIICAIRAIRRSDCQSDLLRLRLEAAL